MNTGAVLRVIREVLHPIPGIGQVWARKRFHVPVEHHRALWGIDNAASDRGWSVRVWQCYRQGWLAEARDVGGQVTRWTHQVRIVGWWEIDDAGDSSQAYHAVLDRIALAFADPLRLRPVAHGYDPPQLVSEGETQVDSYDCHVCELVMPVRQVFHADPAR